MKCERCGKEPLVTIMSFFNTQMICLECEEKEKKHPKYEEAKQEEVRQVRQGNYNFRGIGKPPDL
jgi:hypothetical protein